ncbi:methylated-DNA--[protein]-cysteine S-methyltransferase [Shewanella algidipiscicola]|uniref:Methylated-DNA--protein-cysteine methyltransferase n=1 Tax=Shewanella algidipiscicola TaxID=614070 RepID=A0ABQ4PJX3_9GAMM|nr:methylated-DNA--[protein]-cysteine S-methyltransferase [Shewanella algidipiscicola]GIU48099.1 methylated-DNA--protein-cysteine methyltransferase [Shewanella algidipiscicola]
MSLACVKHYRAMSRNDGEVNFMPIAKQTITTDMGHIVIAANRFGLSDLTFKPRETDSWAARDIALIAATDADKQLANEHLQKAKSEIEQYLLGKLTGFTVPLAPVGTVFQHQVWQALLTQPYGKSCSYSDIAHVIDNPNAVRAVGSANGANHIAIIIPCHRIIGKSGTLTGYAYGLEIKQQLLTLERGGVAGKL